jgi:hypothetical protein
MSWSVHRGRQASADIDELAHTAGRHIADGTPEELPVLPGHPRRQRLDLQHLAGKFAVYREVIFTAQPVVSDSGDVRPDRVQ